MDLILKSSDSIQEGYLSTFVIIASYVSDPAKKNKYAKELKAAAEATFALEEKYKRANDFLRLNNTSDAEGDVDGATKQLMEKFKDYFETHKSQEKNLFLEDFDRLIKDFAEGEAQRVEADNDDDDDMVVGQAPLNVICPITKQRMTDPVKNNICKHIYEKKTTLDMIKMNRETKCPVMGCFNNEFVAAHQLVPDHYMRAYLMIHKD